MAISQLTNLERLKLGIAETANLYRTKAIEKDFLFQMKEILNRIYGDARNQIVNISEDDAISYVLQQQRMTIEILNAVRWNDVTLEAWILRVKEALKFRVLIHFPEITLTNSKRNTHIIRDLYTQFTFTHEGKLVGTVQGLRTTGTKEEVARGYVHSHLDIFVWNSMRFTNFCTGVGPINQTILLLREEWNEVNFEMLCYHLNEMVKWESLEGTPYISIREDRSNQQREPVRDVRNWNDIFGEFYRSVRSRGIKATKILETLKVDIVNDQFTVDSTPDFEKLLAEMIVARFPPERTSNHIYWAFFEESTKQYYAYVELVRRQDPNVDTTKPIIKFKGETKTLNILNIDQNEQQSAENRVPNPNITKNITREIAKQINLHQIRRSRTEAENTFNRRTESPAANPVLVQEHQPS